MLRYLSLQRCPVMKVCWGDPPHIVLKPSLRHRTTLVRGVRTFNFCQLTGGFKCTKIKCFKDLLVQIGSFIRLEWKPHENVGISKPLDTNTNRSVPHVAIPSFLYGVVVHINDLIEVLGGNFGNKFQLLKVVCFVRLNKHVDSNGGQITDCHFIWSRVLNNLGTKVGALDSPKVLLVTLPVTGILVEHVWSPSFNLAFND